MTRGGGVLRWKGALAEGGAALRRVTAAVLALACVSLAFTQEGFIGLGFADGGSAYIVTLLAPVALGAMLLGAPAGAALGLFAGAVLYLHAAVSPLDYYELTFVTPLTSVVMLCLVGFLLGALFALALRGGLAGRKRMLAVAGACLLASLLFSAGFAGGAVAALVRQTPSVLGGGMDAAQANSAWVQALGDAPRVLLRGGGRTRCPRPIGGS